MAAGIPVFEEFDPAGVCACAGCVWSRRTARIPQRLGGHPAAHGARRALVLAAMAGTVLGAGHTVPAGALAEHGQGRPGRPLADDPDTHPQGGQGGLHGASGKPAAADQTPTITRAEIINRAKQWVTAKVPYSLEKYWSDGYRQDCSGFVSMAWNLGRNEWTGTLDKYAVAIGRDELQPGDILLFHNRADPVAGSHVTIFGGWTDYTRAHYIAYEQARPQTRRQVTPYAYWTHSQSYRAYRFKGLAAPAPGPNPGTADRFPGRSAFGPGARGEAVTRLGKLLVARGGGRFYRVGPGPVWSEADRAATRAFQLAQGWTGRDADGLPGPTTWSLLVNGEGRDIPAAAGAKAPAFPGRALFRPGQSNTYVTQLGRQLVKKGFGKHYRLGPGPRWGEADRRNVEAFQRAQGWRGGAADGYPGPETWRRLFS
ncbi:peptidoglycan-binding protein [Streptomyces apocyni]|uniref:peptidoglycan-binding protein n=1 Tax=Streptomyces apocyni TaxID=2654677 RepID=UPI0012EA7601|nr:peptidoglycan-binding protein [Streptomyces apocyni]